MFAVEPQPTEYDLKFRIGSIPVRVHPFFWLVAVLLGLTDNVVLLLIWVGVVFVSILIHELGHALTANFYGRWSRIWLYGFGGLAVHPPTGRPWREIAILLMGPGAGFLLALVLLLVCFLAGFQPVTVPHLPEQWGRIDLPGVPVFSSPLLTIFLQDPPVNFNLRLLLWQAFYVNIFWGLVNLLPVYPLDGGQISRYLLQMSGGSEGTKQSLQLSIVTAILVALLALSYGEWYIGLFFGYLAYVSYGSLEQLGSSGGYWR